MRGFSRVRALLLLLSIALLDVGAVIRENMHLGACGGMRCTRRVGDDREDWKVGRAGPCHSNYRDHVKALLRLRGGGSEGKKAGSKVPQEGKKRSTPSSAKAKSTTGNKARGAAAEPEMPRASTSSFAGLPPPPAAAKDMHAGGQMEGEVAEMYFDNTANLDYEPYMEPDGIVIGQRPVPKIVELFCPGHETYKYYKDGHYTGEEYDVETSRRWQKITNIYAPHYVGVPRIFTERDEDLEGTLDYVLTKDRPATTLDDQLKRTFWQPAGGEPQSLWRDGLVPVPMDEETAKFIKEHEDKISHRKGKTSNFEIPAQSRWLIPIVTAAVDRFKGDHKASFKLNDYVPSPYLHPSKLILDLIQCDWVLRDTATTVDDLYDMLVAKNKELSEWPDRVWSKEGVPLETLAKARRQNFFLGCTDTWQKLRAKGSLETVGRRIDGSGHIDGIGKVTGGTPLVLYQREAEIEADSTASTHADDSRVDAPR